MNKKKNNKKGMTLVELLAVIAIIGMLAVLITPGVLSLRNSVLRNSFKSKLTSIHNAALDYAEDRIQMVPSDLDINLTDQRKMEIRIKRHSESECFNVTVGKLISEGYLGVNNSHTTSDKNSGQDSNGQLVNPLNNESLNSKTVCVRYNSRDAMKRSLVAYIIDECDLYDSRSDIEECLACPEGQSATKNENEHWECQ